MQDIRVLQAASKVRTCGEGRYVIPRRRLRRSAHRGPRPIAAHIVASSPRQPRSRRSCPLGHRFALTLALAASLLPVAARVAGPAATRASKSRAFRRSTSTPTKASGTAPSSRSTRTTATRTSYRWTLQPTVFLTTEGPARLHAVLRRAVAARAARGASRRSPDTSSSSPRRTTASGTRRSYDPTARARAARGTSTATGGRAIARALDVQHALWHPSLRVLLGAGASNESINLTPFDSGTTLIEHDLERRRRRRGSTRTSLRAGLTWDTRDREIGTQSGTWADAIVQRVDKSLGATTSYTRWTATVRHYQPLGARVTFANRLLAQNIVGDAPFYALGEVQTTQKPQDGLGGVEHRARLPEGPLRRQGHRRLEQRAALARRGLHAARAGRRRSCSAGSPTRGASGPTASTRRRCSTSCTPATAAARGSSFGPSFVVALDVGHSSQSTAPIYIGLGYMF